VILVSGEALIDFFPASCGNEEGYVPRPGGSPHNVAIGLGRLGVPVSYLGRLSGDRFGRMLKASLEKSGVDLRYLVEGDEPTALSFIHLSGGKEPEFSFYGVDTADCRVTLSDLPDSMPEEIVAIHLGALAMVREPIGSTLTALMEREHGRRLISFDPNVRPNHIEDRSSYLKRLEHWLRLSDLVKVSTSDLGHLYPDSTPEEAAKRWLKFGPRLVILTCGAAGAVAYTASEKVEVKGKRVSVADTVGAGDAFTAGLLGWLYEHNYLRIDRLDAISTEELRNALKWATRIAAITCTRIGADPPYRAELLE